MNTHPIAAELRHRADNFQNPEHPDYRRLETGVHHKMRGHAINVLHSSLVQKPEREGVAPDSLEQLENDMDTFGSAVAAISLEVQQGIRHPAQFREMLREKAATFQSSIPQHNNEQGLTPAEIAAYLELQKRESLEKRGANDFELHAIDAVGDVMNMWRKRALLKGAPVATREFMHTELKKAERDDVVRVRDISQKMGEEVVSYAAQYLPSPSSRHESAERSGEDVPEVRLSAELYATLSQISKGNTLIHTSLNMDAGARPVSGQLTDGFNTIGDAPQEARDWFLPDTVVEGSSFLPGLHIRQDSGSPDISSGLPEVVCFIPQTKRQAVEVAKKGRFGKNAPTTYTDVDVSMHNPITKNNERVINFIYSFSELRTSDSEIQQELTYRDPATGRAGNRLDVLVPLPESVANALQMELVGDPRKARGLIEALVKERGEISPGVWNGSANKLGIGVRPPTFLDDSSRSLQARQLAARPHILIPVAAPTESHTLERKVFKVIA